MKSYQKLTTAQPAACRVEEEGAAPMPPGHGKLAPWWVGSGLLVAAVLLSTITVWVLRQVSGGWLGPTAPPKCLVVPESHRFDCYPERRVVVTQELCESRGCCFIQSPPLAEGKQGVPWCFYPPDFPSYALESLNQTALGVVGLLVRREKAYYPRDIEKLRLDVEFETDTRLHIKITDAANPRYEVPLDVPRVMKRAENPIYSLNFSWDPFGVLLQRKATGTVLLNTTVAPLIFADQFLQISTSLPSKFLYGLGEHRGSLLHSLDWNTLTLWARDVSPTESFNLYGAHPFYLLMEEGGNAHGVFLLNSNAMEVALQPAPGLTWRTIGGVLDFYIFLGPDPNMVIQQYQQVIGFPAMPPIWALGFHLCRWGYGSSNDTWQTVRAMRNYQIPQDGQWNDIDYMDGYRDFTLDSQKFASLPSLVEDLHKHGQRYVMILDPGISSTSPHGSYWPFDEGLRRGLFLNTTQGQPLIGQVWPGFTAFADFSNPDTHQWWLENLQHFYAHVPFDGLWIDMNEPSNFMDGSEDGCPPGELDNPPYTPAVLGDSLSAKTVCASAKQKVSVHYNLHNLYGLMEAKATASALIKIRGKRPFLISRSTFPSQGRYSGHWLGDNRSQWKDMHYSIPGLLSFSLFGIPLVGDGNAVDVNSEGSSEGFICPLCMKSHGSAEELFKHYEAVHNSGIDSTHGGEGHLSPERDEVSLLRQEVQDLQASLKEERWYSEELKKELEKLQGQRQQESKSDGLTTATSTESLERQLEEIQVENFNIKQMKDLFEQKAAQLATEIVDLKSKYDEEISLRESAEQKVTNLRQELQKERSTVEDLKTELLQRPGVEDVAVLKRELVQVQTLMDKMTLERERESEKLKDECKHLQAEQANSEATIKQLRAELAKGPQEVAVYVQELQKLQSAVQELEQKNQTLTEKLLKKEQDYTQLEEKHNEVSVSKKNVQASFHQKDLDCQQLQAKLSASEASIQRLQTELGEKAEASQKLKEELSEVETKYQHLKAECKQLQQQREEKEQHGLQLQSELSQLHSKLLETERQLGEAHGRLKEQRQLSSEKLMDKEQQVADLQLKLSRAEEQLKEKAANSTELQHQLEKAKQQHQEQQTLQQNTTAKLREAQNDLEQVLRQIGDKDQKIQNLEALLQKSKDNISLLEKEREDLYAKIQAGEGETAVLNQLQEKNHALQIQVTQLTEKLKNQSESHKQAQENLHEQVQEQKAHLRAAQDRVLSLETNITELTSQLNESKEKVSQLDVQVKAKTELLLSAEASKAAQRADLQNHLDTAQNALQDKQQELNKVSAQLDQVTAKLNDKQEYCTQLEASLKEYKEKCLSLEQKTEELEAQLKKLEGDILDSRGSKDQALQELQQQQHQNKELELQTAELRKQLQAAREAMSNAQLDLQKKSEALDQANQQITKQEAEKASLKQNLEKSNQDTSKQLKELDCKMQAATSELQQVKLEKDTLLKDLTDTKDKLSKSSESFKKRKEELEKEIKKGKAAMAEMEKSCQELKHQLQIQTESVAKERNELKNSLEKKEGISKQLSIDLDSARAQVLEIQGLLKEKEKSEQHLQGKLRELKESFEQKKKHSETLQAELKTALLEKAELENKLQQQSILSAQELKAEKGKLADLQKAHDKHKENMEKLQLDLYGKESELLATRQDLKSTEEKLALAQEELVSSRNQIASNNQQIQELKKAKSTLEQDASKKEQQLGEKTKMLQDLQNDRILKEKDLANEKCKTAELQEIRNRLEKESAKLGEELRACKQEFEKEVTNLKDGNQLLIQQKLELQGKIDNANSTLEQEKQKHQAVKDQLKKREEELKKECAEIEAKLHTEKKDKEEEKRKHEEKETKLTMQVTALNENLATMKKEWQSSQRRVSELEKQTDDLRGDNAVLEATVQNNQDERRALLERCIKSEGEIEKLQAKLVEMKKKLDNTTAAMQELGRENQSLQIKHTQALNRKWAEDNEVQNCMACGKGFSVTVRRHHCRQCGNIFCAECSAKNALTPSSKKPVRVCDTCFNDLQG